MKYLLPFDISPGCLAYHNKAFPLGIIKANLEKDYDIWIANKFINCVYRHKSQSFDIIDDDIWGHRQGLTETQTITIRPEVFSNNLIDLLGLIKFMLKSKYYLTGTFNEYYIPRKKPYKDFDFIHDYILFGYDDSECYFKSAGYIDTQKYENFEIEYDKYLESIYKIGSRRVNLWFHRINTDFEVKFDIEFVVQQMKDYVNSKRSSIVSNNDEIYGISVWDMLAKYIFENEKPFLDLRYTRLFMEHKNLMLSRLNVLFEKGFLNNKNVLKEYGVEIVEQAELVHRLCLKYNLSHNIDINARTYDITRTINQKEYDLLKDIIYTIN